MSDINKIITMVSGIFISGFLIYIYEELTRLRLVNTRLTKENCRMIQENEKLLNANERLLDANEWLLQRIKDLEK